MTDDPTRSSAIVPDAPDLAATVDLTAALSAAVDAADRAGRPADDRISAALDESDRHGWRDLLTALRSCGWDPADDPTLGTPQIGARVRCAPRHRGVLRRWLEELASVGVLERTDDGRWRASGTPPPAPQGSRTDAATTLGFSPRVAELFTEAVEHAGPLLRDEIDLQALLFAGGDASTADDTYADNPISRWLNRAVIALLRERCATGPTELLEVGAGVGGLTVDLAPALTELGATYAATDVSRYFTALLDERLGHLPGLTTGTFDVDAPPEPQGWAAGSVDVVVAANVLHNVTDVTVTCRRLARLLRPGGWLIVLETVREHPQLLTSMRFLMSPPADDPDRERHDARRGTDRVFVTAQEWTDGLRDAGLVTAAPLPDSQHPLAPYGQRLLAARAPAVAARP